MAKTIHLVKNTLALRHPMKDIFHRYLNLINNKNNVIMAVFEIQANSVTPSVTFGLLCTAGAGDICVTTSLNHLQNSINCIY